jgi:uncharacterized protein YceH (UPF0502 family)
MSGVVDLPLVMLQKAQHAAEATAALAKLFEVEAGNRLIAIEARLGSVEARLSSLYAGQNAHTTALMRIADIQSEHTTRLEKIEQTLTEHTARFDAIDKRFDAIDKRFDGIGRTLADILAKLP